MSSVPTVLFGSKMAKFRRNDRRGSEGINSLAFGILPRFKYIHETGAKCRK
jgi:hypothetical protein